MYTAVVPWALLRTVIYLIVLETIHILATVQLVFFLWGLWLLVLECVGFLHLYYNVGSWFIFLEQLELAIENRFGIEEIVEIEVTMNLLVATFMHRSIECDRLQRPSMAFRFKSLNTISRFMTFLERIFIMPMHMLHLTAVCLGKVWYIHYSFKMLHPCNMPYIPAFAGLGCVLYSSTSVCGKTWWAVISFDWFCICANAST